jgi:hypothetical protein
VGVDMPELKAISESSSCKLKEDVLVSEFLFGVLLPLPGLVVYPGGGVS